MPWDHPQPFTQAAAPRPGDIDGLQHTNNAVYVQWCERVAWAHSEALGMNLADYRRLDRAMAIRRGAYDYLLPTALGDELTIGTWLLASDGKLTMERRFQLIRNRDQVTILRGHWHLVCIELSTGRARRMPPEFCEVYLTAMVAPGALHSPS
jgi:acyl-CoA thioester hydrolase